MQYPLVPCYIFNEEEFIKNFNNFVSCFQSIYPNYRISYSYKTNYTPYICKLVKELNGYAEVVSEMEYNLAKRIGYNDDKIIFNGPNKEIFPNCILNVDSIDEISKTTGRIGLRVNVDVGQGFVSRFGIDPDDLDQAFALAKDRIVGLHCHISQARSLEAWKKRAEFMLSLADKYFGSNGPEYIDLGSGMFADMPDKLKEQFSNIPSYKDYAEVTARLFADHYKGEHKPILFTEPGTTLVSRYISFVCKVENIKQLRGETFVIVNGSKHNLGEICELKELPVTIISNGNKKEKVNKAKIVGYTCLEHDVLRKNFSEELALGDYLLFENCGGYSLVSKPPFIRPNCAMITEKGMIIKRQETDKEIFATYE